MQSISKVPQFQTAMPTEERQSLHSSETFDFFVFPEVSKRSDELVNSTIDNASLAAENMYTLKVIIEYEHA